MPTISTATPNRAHLQTAAERGVSSDAWPVDLWPCAATAFRLSARGVVADPSLPAAIASERAAAAAAGVRPRRGRPQQWRSATVRRLLEQQQQQ